MRSANLIVGAVAVASLSACSGISDWLHKQDMTAEESFAKEELKPAHPVGVTYEVVSTSGIRKQVSVFFNGDGMARLLEPGNNWNTKTLIDFKKQEVTRKDFNPEYLETKKIDPYELPPVLNAKYAIDLKAHCLGKGVSRGYLYHRWGERDKKNEWEVWTDDTDSFPIYYRSIKNGDATTWTMIGSWIDGSTYNKPTFFTLEADPLPPEELKAREKEKESEYEREKAKEEAHKRVHRSAGRKSDLH